MENILKKIQERQLGLTENLLMSLELVPVSDLQTKTSLLSIAAKGLSNEPRIIQRWIQLALEETDTQLKQGMIFSLSRLDFRKIPDLKSYIDLLMSVLNLDTYKRLAITSLGQLLQADSQVLGYLMSHYTQERDALTQRQILFILLEHDVVSPELLSFFLNFLTKVDADVKELIVRRLLVKNCLTLENLEALLLPTEPVNVRSSVLSHLLNHSIRALNAQVCRVLQNDADPRCRWQAVQVLSSQGSLESAETEALFKTLLSDPEARVRETIAFTFAHTLSMSSGAVEMLLKALDSEKSMESAIQIVEVLAPHVLSMDAIQAGFLKLLHHPLKAELAIKMIHALEPLLSTKQEMFQQFITVYENEKQSNVRAALLKAISNPALTANHQDTLISIYQSALKSTNSEIQSWGLQGLILIPLEESNAKIIEPMAAVLLESRIDGQLRQEAARKLSKLPLLSEALRAELKKTADQSTGELKRICQEALDRKPASSPASTAGDAPASSPVDWEDWQRRVDLDKNVKGVFPDVFFHFDTNPQMGKKILRAALAPDCATSCYQNQISPKMILSFLISKNALDDDFTRYCFHMIFSANNVESTDYYLSVAKTNLQYPEMQASLFQVLDQRTDFNPTLLHEIFMLAFGKKYWDSVREKFLSKQNANAALPYLKFLAGNLIHPEAVGLLDEALKKPGIIDVKTKPILEGAFRSLGRDLEKELKQHEAGEHTAPGPGLLDE